MKVDMSEEAVTQRLRTMGDLWELSVKLMNSGGTKPGSGRPSRGLKIQDSIREVLRFDWDPIGLDSDGAIDEYDTYIAPIYRILVSSRSTEGLIERLQVIERDELGLAPTKVEALRSVAEKLLDLKVTLDD